MNDADVRADKFYGAKATTKRARRALRWYHDYCEDRLWPLNRDETDERIDLIADLIRHFGKDASEKVIEGAWWTVDNCG